MKYRAFISILFCVSAFADNCGAPASAIEQIQGQGDRSPLEGEIVVIEATVTASFQSSDALSGYFVQQPNADDRASHGLFVYSTKPVAVGDHLRLKGRVKEYYGLTELTQVKILANCGSRSLPKAKTIDFAMTDAEREALEGVLVRMPEAYLSDHNELQKYGQLALSRQWPENLLMEPWHVDDGSARKHPDEIEYLAGLTTVDQLTLGTQSAAFNAIVHYSFNEYRLIPTTSVQWAAPVTKAPSKPKGVRLAALNVENLFNGDGQGGRFLKNRGAKNKRGYELQLSNLVAGMNRLQADVWVLNEVENDGFGPNSTVTDLIEQLNKDEDRFKAVVYRAEQTGGAAIQNAIVYDATRIRPVRSPESILQFEGWQDKWHRPFLTQTFSHIETGMSFQVVATHLKSKGGKCPGDSAEKLEAFGACSAQRLEAIQLLSSWLSSQNSSLPVFLMGDLNAHPDDPTLVSVFEKGWQTPVSLSAAYSYVYRGEPAALDYVLADLAAESWKLSGDYWNINSGAFRIDASSKKPSWLGRLRPSTNAPFSDHDPVYVDIQP